MVQTERTVGALDEGEQYYGEVVSTVLASKQQALQRGLTRLMGSAALTRASVLLVDALRGGGKVMVVGNGGSAAEAQHFAAELVGRFQHDRAPLAALALSTDSSILTAVANDYGYDQVFARQVLALGRSGDLLLTFSTSGESENLLRAAEAARRRGMAVVAVVGAQSCRLEQCADLTVYAHGADAAGVQELHMIVTHVLCGIAESEVAGIRP